MDKTTGTIDFAVPLAGGGKVTVKIEPPFSDEDGTFIRGLVYSAVGHLSSEAVVEESPTPKAKAAPKKPHGLTGRKYPKVPCSNCGRPTAKGQGMKAHLRKCLPAEVANGPNGSSDKYEFPVVWSPA